LGLIFYSGMKTQLILIGAAFLVSCASPEPKEPDVHPAALSAQNYFVESGMPVREVNGEKKEFFFKKCNVDNTGPYPTKTTYDCNEP